jgi:hypothetical protein
MQLRRSIHSMLFLLLALSAVLLVACDEGTADQFEELAPTETPAVNVNAILNDAAEVREMLVQASSLYSGDEVADVSFSDDTLTVVATSQIDGIEHAERFCHDLTEAIAATDVNIVVEDANGATLAQCRFSS